METLVIHMAPKKRAKFKMGDRYTRFEKARILGARALQITMGAPILIDIPPDMVDPLEIAEMEYREGIIPITVKRDD